MRAVLPIVLAIVCVVGAGVAACGGQEPTSTATQTGTTAGQLAEAGKAVYTPRCAKCHGDRGQGLTGPAIIGAGNSLAKYGTAQGLLDFVDSAMPADAPGSLSQSDYLSIISFLLVQNNFVAPGDELDAGRLGNITLK